MNVNKGEQAQRRITIVEIMNTPNYQVYVRRIKKLCT
jgi:hypothetical protein